MKIQVLDINGSNVKELSLNEKIWNIEPHEQAIFDAVIAQQASKRQATHKVKNKGEVSGGGRKPWKQKGTGRARQGSIRAPQWKGGGVVFGPTPNRNYLKHVNKKVRKLAIKSALSLKAKENNITVVNEFKFENPSTKNMCQALDALKIKNQKILIVTKEVDELVIKSARNIEKINIINSKSLNIYDLLNASKLLLTENAILAIEEVYG